MTRQEPPLQCRRYAGNSSVEPRAVACPAVTCNWFHSLGRDAHFCPNVFPLATPQDPIKALRLRTEFEASY
jgi:hypothetical protein